MNGSRIFGSIAAVAAYVALTCLILNDIPTAKRISYALFVLAVLSLILMVISTLRQSIGLQFNKDDKSKKTSESVPQKVVQTPVLPMDATTAEQKVMAALRAKLTEYEGMEDVGCWKSRWYGEDLGVFGYECELDSVRKNLKDAGKDYKGEDNICSYLTMVSKPYSTESARERHFASYFNERCHAIAKKSIHIGLDESLEQVLVLSDYMLEDLGVRIDRKYIALKIRETEILYHIARLKNEQKLKEQEERKAQRDYERALKDAARNEEKARLELDKQREALEKAASEQEKAKLQEKITTLEELLQEALAMKERAMSMAQQTRSGYVYVISNVRSFGEGVYKIGMTRRLDPMDRVHELGDASVPFPFDVHYMIYTDDAPKLEAELHQRFAESKMNSDNYRKEFFRVSLEEIETALREYKMIE